MKLGEAIIHVSKGKLGLCVAMVNDKVVGLITDGDVRRAMESLQDKFFNVPVEQVMTRTAEMRVAGYQDSQDSRYRTITRYIRFCGGR